MPREVANAAATVAIHRTDRASELATARARDARAAAAREVRGADGAGAKAAAMARSIANPAAAVGVPRAARPALEATRARRRVAREGAALVGLRAQRSRRETRAEVCGGVAEPVAAVLARAAGAALEAAAGSLAETEAVERVEVTGAAAGRAVTPTGAARATTRRRRGAGTHRPRIGAGFVRPTRAVAVTGARVGRCGHGRRGRGRRTAHAHARAGARVAAARAGPDRPLLCGAVRGIRLDLARRSLGRREAARDRVELAAGRMGRAFLHDPGAALVGQDGVRLLCRAAHVRAVARRSRAVAVGGDCRPGVRDVALVGVGRGVALGVAGNGGPEDGQERCE